jgi:uncharacterized membrane protein (Fun14 family)
MNSEHVPKPDEPGITFGQRVGRAYHLMPHWTRKLLVFSLVLGIIGGAAEASFAMKPKTRTVTKTVPAAKVTAAPAGAPAGSSGFVGGGGPVPSSTPQMTTVTREEAVPPTLMERLTPYATRGGFSLFVGIIFGVIFRAFVKISAMVTAVALAGVAALSYLHVINLDRSAVQSEVSTGLGWVRHQAVGLKNDVFARLPSTTAAGVGFFFGLRRK